MVLLIITVLTQTASSFRYMPREDAYRAPSKPALHKHIARIQDIPHHALIVYGTYFCSGSLIRSRIVVTTASCFNKRSRQNTVVKVGASTVTGMGQVIPVKEIKIHEYYKHDSAANNDIALLALKDVAVFGDDVKKISLIDPEVALRVGTTIEVTGWGHSNLPQRFLNNLVWSEMVLIDTNVCVKHYGGLISASNFCAKYQIDRRLSDNGGPAVYRDVLIGMLSFGGTNIEEPHIAVFTNASYFNRWIMLNSRRLVEKYFVYRDSGGSKINH
ncbi:trypsin-5-like [Ostrinia furnacalis]|uniref:trypsin-5-like n=1 Tax=Ostrinia furnacalis TaxID=93504 RepID=UPI00103C86EA|nr:trypsin-5-like [Ostrinia furnacalis]